MACIYELKINGKLIKKDSLLELSKLYYKSGAKLSNQKIYSTEEIVESVMTDLDPIIRRTDEIKNDKTKKPVTAFISDVNTEIFKSLKGIKIDQNQLVPKYTEKYRILHYILESMPEQYKFKIKELEDLQALIAKEPSLQAIYDEKYKEIKDIIESEQLTNQFGIDLHKGISSLIRGEDLDKVIDNILQKHEEILDNIEGWRNRLKTTLEQIYSELSNVIKDGGRILSELDIDTVEENHVQLKGTIDIVAIDSQGHLHIYDFKISKNPYYKWDSVKTLTVDWQLAFYRGMLGQYTDVKSATLNVIPIAIGSVYEDNSTGKTIKKILHTNLKYDGQISLLVSEKKGLREGQKLTKIVNALVTQKTIIPFDEEKSKEFINELKFFLPNYEIKTNLMELDIDKLVENAKQRQVFDIYNNFPSELTEDLINDLAKLGFNQVSNSNIFKYDWLPGTTIEQKAKIYRDAIKVYVDFASKHKNSNLISLRNSIEASINTGKTTISWHNKEIESKLNNLLKPYLLGGHKVVSKIPEIDDLGMILLQRKDNQRYVIISITSFLDKATYDKDLLFGDLEYLKSYFFLNKFFDELNLKENKVEAIEVFNLQWGETYYRPYQTTFKKFVQLMDKRKLSTKLEETNLPDITETLRNTVRNVLRNFGGSGDEKSKLEGALSDIVNPFSEINLIKLLEVQKNFREAFPYLEGRTLKELSFNDEREYLYALVSTLIIMNQNLAPTGDFVAMKNFAIAFSDFKSIFSGLYSDKQEEYDANGKKIQGIIGGLSTITPDKVPSADLRNINILINSANSFVRQDMYKQSTIIGNLTKEYYKQIHYTPTEQNWIGNYRSKNVNFWVKENGDISNIWSVKNPYLEDERNTMTDVERDYLKKILFQINKYKLEIEDTDSIDLTSKATLATTTAGQKVLASIESGKYFEMPIIRNQQWTRAGALWKDGYKGYVDKAKLVGEEITAAFDPRELQEEERINIKATELGYYEMYDIYDKQTSAFKKEMIDRNTPQYYELSLDIIAHRIAFNKIRQKYVNKILPIVNSYMWWMKLRAGIANEDISKQLDYVANRVKLGILDSPIADEEATDALKVVSTAKKITTAAILGFRPLFFFKELTVGMYRGIALASSNIYGRSQFSHKSFFEAVKKLITVDNKMSLEWNLPDAINNFYGFANRDVNTAVQRMQTNRRGIFMGLSPWMYSMNTMPDYYNRLGLFMAKMIEEGSYDAHIVKDGMLVYDPKLDKRFEKYFKNRDLHKDSNGKYIPAKNDIEYNKQRRLYLLIQSEINEDRERVGKPALTEENDLITHAYSEKERMSYKTFTDTVYGYYDKDSQAAWHNAWYGMVFLQFLQFWPGKMSMWFGKNIKPGESLMGDHVQKIREVDGKEVPVWREALHENELNPEEVTGFKETLEDTGDPWLEWVGTPQEGLAQSMFKTIRYTVTGDMGKFKNDKLLRSRVTYGIADSLLMMLIFGLIAALIRAWIMENGTDGLDGQTIAFAEQVNKRVLTESNLYTNTFGALKTTPIFLSYGSKIAGDISDAFTGDKTMSDLAKDIKATEIFTLGD